MGFSLAVGAQVLTLTVFLHITGKHTARLCGAFDQPAAIDRRVHGRQRLTGSKQQREYNNHQ